MIAGYNTATKEEKDKIDEKKLGQYTGALKFALAFCWLFIVASAIWDIIALFWIRLALFIVVFCLGYVYINTGDRLRK